MEVKLEIYLLAYCENQVSYKVSQIGNIITGRKESFYVIRNNNVYIFFIFILYIFLK